MADARVSRVLEALRASQFADLKGARVSASIPIAESLLNELIAATLPPSIPLQRVTLHPKQGDRARVSAKLTRPEFLPPISLTLEIESQPAMPDSPLVLRVTSLPGLVALAGAALPVSTMLPPGVRLERQRVLVDMRMLLDRFGYGAIVPFLDTVKVTTEEGRLILDVDVRV
jgi:hypothetical protein